MSLRDQTRGGTGVRTGPLGGRGSDEVVLRRGKLALAALRVGRPVLIIMCRVELLGRLRWIAWRGTRPDTESEE